MDPLFYQQALSGMYWTFMTSVRSLLCALAAGPFLTLPSSCTVWGGTALHAVPCLAMLCLQQVPFFISCLLFFLLPSPQFAKQAPGAPFALPAFQSLSHCCRPGCRVTSPQAPSVTRASCAFRSSKACFKNCFFRSKGCLCQYMPWPEKVTAVQEQRTRGQRALVEEFHTSSDPCQGVAVTFNSLCDNRNRKTPSLPLLAGLWNTRMALELGHWQLSRY